MDKKKKNFKKVKEAAWGLKSPTGKSGIKSPFLPEPKKSLKPSPRTLPTNKNVPKSVENERAREIP